MSYYPVLKFSNAEMGDLHNLKKETKEIITPIIESKVIPENKVDVVINFSNIRNITL